MTTPRLSLTTGGALLTALLLLTGYALAQSLTPTLTLLCEGLADPNGIVIGSGGVIYGTTYAGGSWGQAYSLTPPTSPGAPWTYTVLHSFTGGDGALPTGVLAIGRGGVLYGVTHLGGGGTGCFNNSCGVVYALIPPASSGGAWNFRVIYRFMTDASSRPAGVVVGAGGVLYGSTTYGNGTLFSLAPPASPGGAWTYTQLYSFTGGSDGSVPGALVIRRDGVLFGTTGGGGTGHGTVFSLTPPATPGGSWALGTLYSFTGGSSGLGPSGLVIGTGGVLYGVMAQGGDPSCSATYISGCGTVFAVAPPKSPGGSWVFNTLYRFTGGNDGYNPSGVVIGKNGGIVGTTYLGGPSVDNGTVFSLTPPGSPGEPWTKTTVYSFPGITNGSNPPNGVVFGAGGTLYGTVYNDAGCVNGCGGVFLLTL